jgi:hypothetical protein
MSDAEEKPLTGRQRRWLEQVRGCEVSPKTILDYAARHGLAVGYDSVVKRNSAW